MNSKIAQTLAFTHSSYKRQGIMSDIDLAFKVIDLLESASPLMDPWSTLLKRARGLKNTRSARSSSQFRLAYQQAVKDIVLCTDEALSTAEEFSAQREATFEFRVSNLACFVKYPFEAEIPEIDSELNNAIIEGDSPLNKERENEFRTRLSNPGSFRRRD